MLSQDISGEGGSITQKIEEHCPKRMTLCWGVERRDWSHNLTHMTYSAVQILVCSSYSLPEV